MTRAQLVALKLLEHRWPQGAPTSRTTAHGFISGRCAQALINRGWARRTSAWTDSGWLDTKVEVKITAEGSRAALDTLAVNSAHAYLGICRA